jgi:hypothetical protein
MARRSEYTIAPADMVTATDDEVMETARLRQELSIERTPEDPPAPLEVIAQQLRARPPGQWRTIFLARDSGGKLAATASPGGISRTPRTRTSVGLTSPFGRSTAGAASAALSLHERRRIVR